MTGRAPFKHLFVHGFVVDEEGKKMSKSIGNVVDPQRLIFGDGKVAVVGCCWSLFVVVVAVFDAG